MEQVLDVYTRPYNPDVPLICMDEKPVQLLEDARLALPMKAGQVRREDYEYERKGTCSLFLFTEPLAGWRLVHARSQRTKRDWALEIQELLDLHYPQARRVCLVLDNLNTHTLASLYEAFVPATARALASRLELCYTPKHGSWLNMAEVELSALTLQCLDRRIGSMDDLQREVSAWARQRNEACKTLSWQFTTEDARIRLKHLYPQFD